MNVVKIKKDRNTLEDDDPRIEKFKVNLNIETTLSKDMRDANKEYLYSYIQNIMQNPEH